MLLWKYFNDIVSEKNKNKMQIERIRDDLIKNLDKKGIRTSFVQINLNAENLMIRLNIEGRAGKC